MTCFVQPSPQGGPVVTPAPTPETTFVPTIESNTDTTTTKPSTESVLTSQSSVIASTTVELSPSTSMTGRACRELCVEQCKPKSLVSCDCEHETGQPTALTCDAVRAAASLLIVMSMCLSMFLL